MESCVQPVSFSVTSRYRKILSDTLTPVSIFLRLRDHFANSLLFEHHDTHNGPASYSYVCFNPVARFEFDGQLVKTSLPDGHTESTLVDASNPLMAQLDQFRKCFDPAKKHQFPFQTNGLFGHMSYNAVQHFENISLQAKPSETDIPCMVYQVFRYVIVFHHQKNELHLFEHTYSQDPYQEPTDTLPKIEYLLKNRNTPTYPFQVTAAEQSNFTDEEFLNVIDQGKQHCMRGDVFQIVLSRQFSTAYQGDDFNVYRAMRSLNPSPYMFYFDYGNVKLLGCSPESQIVIKDRKATIFPIAGTFRRTGDDATDLALAKKLHDDPKESAEHVMLVDLARNDLSRHCNQVEVASYKQIQYLSHVIHLKSKVVGELSDKKHGLQLVGETFPAGTLSGAPKHRAMQLIDRYEKNSRGFYAGCIGHMDFNGDVDHAIMIRTFLSRRNTLYYQAGAGIVSKSNTESELQEVHNKLMALRAAIACAETF